VCVAHSSAACKGRQLGLLAEYSLYGRAPTSVWATDWVFLCELGWVRLTACAWGPHLRHSHACKACGMVKLCTCKLGTCKLAAVCHILCWGNSRFVQCRLSEAGVHHELNCHHATVEAGCLHWLAVTQLPSRQASDTGRSHGFATTQLHTSWPQPAEACPPLVPTSTRTTCQHSRATPGTRYHPINQPTETQSLAVVTTWNSCRLQQVPHATQAPPLATAKPQGHTEPRCATATLNE
jgi:hypothetical protein